jgi:hypothetical protein
MSDPRAGRLEEKYPVGKKLKDAQQSQAHERAEEQKHDRVTRLQERMPVSFGTQSLGGAALAAGQDG